MHTSSLIPLLWGHVPKAPQAALLRCSNTDTAATQPTADFPNQSELPPLQPDAQELTKLPLRTAEGCGSRHLGQAPRESRRLGFSIGLLFTSGNRSFLLQPVTRLESLRGAAGSTQAAPCPLPAGCLSSGSLLGLCSATVLELRRSHRCANSKRSNLRVSSARSCFFPCPF